MSKSSSDRTKAYAEAVVTGKIVAGPHVRNACRRHLDDLKHGAARGLRFDREAADRAFRFYETGLLLSEGQFDGQPFRLDPSQAFIVGSLFGWKRKHPVHGWVRRFRRAYVEQGKGNGKSPLAGGLGLIGLCADGEAGAQIYSAAAKRDQAAILFADAVKMVKAQPKLKKRLRLSGGEGKEYNIAHVASGSFFRPVSRDHGKTGSGPRPYFVLVDEIHELPDRTVLETLERGFKFRVNPLLLMITNSGSDRNSVCREEHERAIKAAAGNPNAVTDPTYQGEYLGPAFDETFAYVCALDEGDDPLEDPRCWIKANPLLGVTITEEYLAAQVAEAKAIPGKLNGILRLHFCVWTDAETAWMTRKTLEPCIGDFDPAEHHGKDCWAGADLSQNRDITALAFVVQTGTVPEGPHEGKPTFDAWIEAFTPGDTAAARHLRDNIDYPLWIEQGHLNAPKGESISFRHVAQAIAEAEHDFALQCVAYDRYAYKRGLEPECADLGIATEFVEHPQGGTKKGKLSIAQLEEQKYNKLNGIEAPEPEGLWMPGSVRILEDLLLEGRIRLRRNPVLISAIMSAVTDEDRWGNHWLAKLRSTNKIDAAVALCMAVGAASHIKPRRVATSPWDDPAFSMAA